MQAIFKGLGGSCLGASVASYIWYQGKDFDLLVIYGIILIVGAELLGALQALAHPHKPEPSIEGLDVIRLLENVNDRLIKVQLAIENLSFRK
jgi:hypothetical protein